MRRAQKSRQFGLASLFKRGARTKRKGASGTEGAMPEDDEEEAMASAPPRSSPAVKSEVTAGQAPGEGEEEEDRHWFHEYWRMVGGGSLSVSLAIHAIAIIIAIFLVSTTRREPAVDFLPGGGSKGAAQASSEISNQVQRNRTKNFFHTPNQRVVSLTDKANIKLSDLPLEHPEMPPISNLLQKTDAMGMGHTGTGGGSGTGTGIGNQSGFMNLPPMFQSRCNNVDRIKKIQESGGTPECETAVNKALGWLSSKQNKDGSWGNAFTCGMTGFALLCYLGHCEMPDSPAYGTHVMAGLHYLMETQNKGRYSVFSVYPAKNAATYEHGICTYAVGEMYSLARMGNSALPGLREAFERGVSVIIKNQMPNGSWCYDSGGGISYAQTGQPDLSVTGWQYQALKAAKYSGLGFNGLNQSIDKAVRYMESTQTQDGGFGRPRRESGYNQWNLSGVAVLGLETLGHGKSPAINRGIQFATKYFTSEPPDWHRNANLYCWYYYSQAFFQYGGTVWKGWNDRVLHQLLDNQTKEGNWKRETADSDLGSSSYASTDEDVYRTTLCTLMLEVYYRYLKVGDREAGSVFDRK